MKFYSIFWKICIIFLIFIGIIVILNDKQSLSLFRLTIFGLCPLILSIILFKLRKNKNIIIISSNFFIMTFFALVIIEIFLLYPREPFLVSNNIYDIENKQTCGNSFKTKKNLSIYPVGGISKKKIKFLNQENLSFSFRENDRFGFNNEDKLWNLEKINSVFIGDSFTYGADVNYFESFVELYKKNVEATINLGCGGNGPIIEYATFVEYVINLNLKPDYLFWVYYPGNDLTKDLISEHSSFYANYLKKEFNQNLKSKQTEINKTIKDFIEAKKKLENKKNQKSKNTFDYKSLYKFQKIRNLLGFTNAYTKENFTIFNSIIKQTNNEIKKWNGKLVFIFIPSEKRYTNLTSYYDEHFYNLTIKKFLQKNKIKFIDFNDKLKKHDNPRIFYSSHLNSKGNLLLSNMIIESLK